MQPTFTQSRKRAASSAPVASSLESATAHTSDQLKRNRTQDDPNAVEILPVAKSWPVDIGGILSSPTLRKPLDSQLVPHDNFGNHVKGRSIYVICVQGACHLHYDLLWYASTLSQPVCSRLADRKSSNALPDLYTIAPTIQPLVLCRDPSSHIPSTSSSISLPLVEAIGGSYNHFVRLGLLHPLGSGQDPLDALVVLDAQGRRRLLLPFGWGAGRHVGAVGGGQLVQRRFMDALTSCVRCLLKEIQNG
jgi:hypothetical protein